MLIEGVVISSCGDEITTSSNLVITRQKGVVISSCGDEITTPSTRTLFRAANFLFTNTRAAVSSGVLCMEVTTFLIMRRAVPLSQPRHKGDPAVRGVPPMWAILKFKYTP